MIVDDTEVQLDLMASLLRRLGHRVRAFTSGRAALAAAGGSGS